jgi:SAM-dependent methyltransferase
MTPCPICASTDATLFLRARDHVSGDWFELQQCPACKLVFVSPPPPDLGRYYHPYYRRYRPLAQRIFRHMYRVHAHAWARQLGRTGRALEIGCGDGWMLASLRDIGWRVLGTERSAESAQFAVHQQGLAVIVGELGALKPAPAFDLIFMHHVLEHLPDPMTTLRQCVALLKPGGTLIVAVPNFASWQFRVSRQGWFHLDVPRHLVHFSPQSLTDAMQRAGLRVESVRFVSFDQDPFGWMVSLLNRLGFPQTRWLHWLGGREREPSLSNVAMLLLSPALLALGFVLAPLSWLMRAGACMEVRAVR